VEGGGAKDAMKIEVETHYSGLLKRGEKGKKDILKRKGSSLKIDVL